MTERAILIQHIAKSMLRGELEVTRCKRDFDQAWNDESEIWLLNAGFALDAMQGELLRIAQRLGRPAMVVEDPMVTAVRREERRADVLEEKLEEAVTALRAVWFDLKQLADSGDSGNWRAEDHESGKLALACLAKHDGGGQ